MIWYFENLRRFRYEREAIEALAVSSDWLVPGQWRLDEKLRLIWDGDILVGGQTRAVSLRYPNHFPHSPALVVPRNSNAHWSTHQYGAGGELCLEYGPDNWHPDVTGAEMIRSAQRLLQGESSLVAGSSVGVPSRHTTTLGQDLRSKVFRLIVTRELLATIVALPETAFVNGKVILKSHKEYIGYAIGSLTLPSGSDWIDPSVPTQLKSEGYESALLLIRWPPDRDLPPIQSAKEFRAALAAITSVEHEAPHIFVAQDAAIHGYRLWDDDTITEISAIPAQAAAVRVDESHGALVNRTVAVVGCGSLGSKVAVMLARAGVGKFLIVDDDVMLPDNLIRHDLDWRDVGAHKADAVARRIELVNPYATCRIRRHHVGGQEASGGIETLISSLAGCDLLIDATADAHAFGYISAAAASGGKPMVWAEVFGGGFGGLIARSRPSFEPDPASMRRKIEHWCREHGCPIERAVNYETQGSGPPLIADDADVSVIAAHAARLTTDTLIPRNPSMFPYSVYLIGMAQGWIFDQPFDTRPIDIGLPESNVAPPVDQELVDAEMERIRELFKTLPNATATTSVDRSTPET